MDKSELKISVVIGRGHGQALHKIVDQDLEQGLEDLQRLLEQKYGIDAVAIILKRIRIPINFRGRNILVERYLPICGRGRGRAEDPGLFPGPARRVIRRR